MSREIKFRCWDQKDKKYLLPEKQGFVILPTMPSFGVTLPYENRSNPGNIDEDCVDWADADLLMGRYELEQYTGLKDKNGKEIYEGDIVRLQLPEDGPQNQNFVGYGCGGWKEDKHCGEHKHKYLEQKIVWDSDRAMFMDVGLDDGKDEPLAWLNRYCCEVIGNIHERIK